MGQIHLRPKCMGLDLVISPSLLKCRSCWNPSAAWSRAKWQKTRRPTLPRIYDLYDRLRPICDCIATSILGVLVYKTSDIWGDKLSLMNGKCKVICSCKAKIVQCTSGQWHMIFSWFWPDMMRDNWWTNSETGGNNDARVKSHTKTVFLFDVL